MVDLACPQCGAPIAFRSQDLPVRVCDYCHSAIRRDDSVLRVAGKAAVVPEDVSPLRLGTRGRWDGQGFELVGRVRWRWADGAWNEWLALRDDASLAWLGEAMGRYMMLAPVAHSGARTTVVRTIANGDRPVIGKNAQIDGVSYRVADVKEATCVASEGELPSPTIAGTKVLSVDLMASDGACASVQREGTETSVYAGRYVTLADLRATDLRAFDGWPMPRFAA